MAACILSFSSLSPIFLLLALQEITQKILEAVGTIAGSSLEQTSWLSRNLEVRAQPQVSLEESDADDDAQGIWRRIGKKCLPQPGVGGFVYKTGGDVHL